MKLSEQLTKWRSERPDEWRMDEFIKHAEDLELERHNALIALDTARSAIMQAHMKFAEMGDRAGTMCMRSNYKAVNEAICSLGEESIDLADLEALII